MTTPMVLAMALAGGLLAGALSGCAAASGREASGLSGPAPTQPPADPLFRRSFSTSQGTWNFEIGGGYTAGDH